MNYYDNISPDVAKTLKQLNDEVAKEQNKETPDNKRILKLKQQILMKGLEMSVCFPGTNYKPYIF